MNSNAIVALRSIRNNPRKKRNKLFPKSFLFLYITLHLAFLIVMAVLPIYPYFTYDDYEIYSVVSIDNLSKDYLLLRQLFINICCVLNSFWSGKILNGPRVFNLIVFYFCIREIAKICKSFDYKKRLTNKICLLLIILPQFLIVSSSMVKDVLLMYLVARILRGIIYYFNKKKQNYFWLVLCCVVLYFTRYGLLEILALLFAFFLILRSKHKFFLVPIVLIITVFVIYKVLGNNDYMYTFTQKISQFEADKTTDSGFMNYLRITTPSQFYRLFLAMPYMLTLGMPKFDVKYSYLLWMHITGFLSFIPLFLIPAFFLGCFAVIKGKNKNEILMLLFFTVYHALMAINSPSLSRYILCIYPIFILLSMKGFNYQKIRTKDTSLLIIFGFITALLYFVYIGMQLLRGMC